MICRDTICQFQPPPDYPHHNTFNISSDYYTLDYPHHNTFNI